MYRKLLFAFFFLFAAGVLQAQHYGTYIGGNVNELADGLLVDLNGNVYVLGSTSSQVGIATPNGFDTSFSGTSTYDVFLAKFDAKGNILWCTYYGGTNLETGYDICFDKDSNILVTGLTQSTADIATADGIDQTLNGTQDGFIARYTPEGTLIYASYLGYNTADYFLDIAIDKDGYVYLVGQSDSPDKLPYTGIQQDSVVGGYDLFLVKLSPDLKTIVWATFYGGTINESGLTLLIDENKNIYTGGQTNSLQGIATAGAYQTTHGGISDIYLCKFDSNGVLITATYLGGNSVDAIFDMAFNSSKDIVLCGQSTSTSGLTTPGAWQTANGGSYDGILARVDRNLQVKWVTLMGGNSVDVMSGVAIGNADTIFVMGNASSQSGIATPGSYRENYNGGPYDCFFQQFDPGGQRVWGSYLGGSGQETGRNAVYGPDKNLYVVGHTYSDTGIATAGSYQTTRQGVIDAFYFKYEHTPPVFNACSTPIDAGFTINRMIQCTRDNEFIFTDTLSSIGSVTHYWDFGNGTFGSNQTETVHYDPLVNNQITVRLTTTVDGVCIDSALKTIYLVSSPEKAVIAGNTPVYMGSRQTYSVPFHNGSTYAWFFESGSGSSFNSSIQIKWLTPDTVMLKMVETNGSGCVGDTAYLEVIIKDPTGIASVEGNPFVVYPNPSQGKLAVSYAFAGPVNMSVFTTEGKQLLSVRAESDEYIDLGALQAGIYLLEITDEDGSKYFHRIEIMP